MQQVIGYWSLVNHEMQMGDNVVMIFKQAGDDYHEHQPCCSCACCNDQATGEQREELRPAAG